jgi:uroporphyrinogen III methyltransferase/synthase
METHRPNNPQGLSDLTDPHTDNGKTKNGRVVLVGAGPGDPGLITVAGLNAIKAADAVVFDALANAVLLDAAPKSAERYDVGKRAKFHKLTQDQTNDLLVKLAKEGKLVVRLKGGDPYLFGRGAEEAAFCAKHGVRCDVVPGVTSGLAAPATAGIPVTHRKVASTVTIITGHEDPTKGETSIDYAALAGLIKVGGTACFYMGVGRLQAICDSLTACGLAPTTPAALIQWGTLPAQRHAVGTLESIKQKVDEAGLGSPAIIVVGEVAAIEEPGLDYFTNRPLFGQRIVVTRTRQQASDLRLKLEALGADVLEAPTIRIVEPGEQDQRAFNDAIARLSGYDAAVFTSANAVNALADKLDALGLDSRALAGLHVSCIGGSTAAVLRERLAIAADFVPQRSVAEAFAEELLSAVDLKGKRVLLPRADIARPALPTKLREAGCVVDEIVVYETEIAEALPDDVLEALRAGEVDWVTFTSSSTARNLVEMLGGEAGLLSKCKLASIGPKTSATMRECDLNIATEAQRHDIDGLIEALVACRQAE